MQNVEKIMCDFTKEENVIKKLEKIEPFELGDEWARGSFGQIYVVDTPTGQICVKRVPEMIDHVNRELEICMILAPENHPNIVQFLGYWIENTIPSILYLVMEFVPETLRSVLDQLNDQKMRMKTDRMISLMRQLSHSLNHLEKIGLMHRDIKPENILVNLSTNKLVLADFGSAKFIIKDKPNATYVCTRFYRAPCLILGRDIYSSSIDIWSFGCVLAEFAYGRPLFTGDSQIDVMSKIIRIRGMVTVDDIAHMPVQYPQNIDPVGVGLNCIVKPWSNVFTIKIKEKRINTSYGEFYEKILDACLQWNPLKRILASNLDTDIIWKKNF